MNKQAAHLSSVLRTFNVFLSLILLNESFSFVIVQLTHLTMFTIARHIVKTAFIEFNY